jgi:hypothetical protein
MNEIVEKLKRNCSKCGSRWVRSFIWAKDLHEKSEVDVLQVYEGCPQHCENGLLFMGESGTDVTITDKEDKEKIKAQLKEMGYELSEESED